MSEKKKEDDNNPDISGIKNYGKFIFFIEFFILFLFCCSYNSIIRDKKPEIIEKFQIPEKDIAQYGLILQLGRVFGTIFIIALVLKFKAFNNIQYFTFASILIKIIAFFLIYYFDLTKEYTSWVMISIFIQGLCHSLIELFFHVWINHFCFWNLCLLSILIGASPLSNFFGPYITKNDSISLCSLKLFICIVIFDVIFVITAFIFSKYFDLSISKDEKVKDKEKYEKNDNRNKEFKEKMEFENLKSTFSKKYDFFFITLSRAILKFSFCGIYALLKKYYYKLDGDEELNEFLTYIPFINSDNILDNLFIIPSIGLFIGAILSFFDWFKKNETILIISFLIGISGIFACINNKLYFVISIFFFYVFANLIIPSLIQKSFDCFKDEKQLQEISYAFNCFIYLVIGNLISSFLNANIESTNFLMKMYLLIAWVNLFFIIKYIYAKKEGNSDSKNKNSEGEELKETFDV